MSDKDEAKKLAENIISVASEVYNDIKRGSVNQVFRNPAIIGKRPYVEKNGIVYCYKKDEHHFSTMGYILWGRGTLRTIEDSILYSQIHLEKEVDKKCNEL